MKLKQQRIIAVASLVICMMSCMQTLADSPGVAAPMQPYLWKNAPIVGGGFVSGIIAHPTERGLMYARTDIGGAYRRISPRSPWVPITDWIDKDHWTYAGIESLAIDPNDPKYVYIAAGCYTNNWSGNGAILRSNDRGDTFSVTPMPFKMGGNEDGRGMGERLVVDPTNGSHLFFGSRKNGFWHSDDRGVSWTQIAGFPKTDDTNGIGISCVVFDISSSTPGSTTQRMFAGVASLQKSVYESTDAGANWQPVPDQPAGLFPHHMMTDGHGTLYLTYGNGPGPNGVTDGAVYKFEMGSHKWTNITPVPPDNRDKFGYSGLTLDPHHPDLLMVSTLDRWSKTDDLFRSTDAGAHWISIREKSVRDWSAAPWLMLGQKSVGIGHWICSIQIDPFDSDHLLYGTGWGMWETHDLTSADKGLPTHWQVAAQGIEEGVMNDLISPPAGAHLLTVMWDIDGFRHDDLNKSPTAGSFNPHCGGDSAIDFAENRPEIVCRVYGGQPVGGENDRHSKGAYSIDNGTTWTPFASSPGSSGDGTIAVSANGKRFVWTPKDGTESVSSDNGKTWTPCQGVPRNLRVISDRFNADYFYACDDHGTLYASEDGGATFQSRAKGLPAGQRYLKAVPGKQGDLWLASQQGLLFSKDGGKTFGKSAGPHSAARIGFGMAAPGLKYPAIYVVGEIAGQYGFYRSDDHGQNWTRINDNQHQYAEITAIAGDPRIYGRVYIASRSRGTLYGDINTEHR